MVLLTDGKSTVVMLTNFSQLLIQVLTDVIVNCCLPLCLADVIVMWYMAINAFVTDAIVSVTKALMAIYHMAITSAKHSGKQQLTITSVKT